jgi:hypothetical protein
MPRFERPLVGLAAGLTMVASVDARAGEEAPSARRSEAINWFEAVTGGHYFGEDESEEVKRLTSDGQKALLEDPNQVHRAQAKGQIAQLQDRLNVVNALTVEQSAQLEAIFIVERDRQERDTRQRYSSLPISGRGGTWYGLYLLASDQLGTPAYEQFLEQTDDFSRRQVSAVASVLTPEQLKVYEQIQRERVAHQRASLAQQQSVLDAQKRAYENGDQPEGFVRQAPLRR